MANITNSNKIIDLLNGIKQRLQQIEGSIPENVSELTNDAGYITNAVSDLVNYYDKGEVDDLLAGIVGLDIRKVDQLPDEGEAGVIYLVPSPSAQDTYDEYIWVASDSAFEKLGNFHVDFSNYYDKDEVDNLLDQKADASDIPTVNDGTLDIQLNGTSVETFSANSENNKTANIEVTKSTVGLGNVDNTSDADKPISTATQAALDLKADKTELPTVNDARITVQKNSESVDSFTLNQNTDNTINITINKADVGLDKVDNTSDADKPISTATQAALDLKADKTDLDNVYTKTEVDTALGTKQDTLTAGTGITIDNNVISTNGTGDVKYDDFKFVEMTDSIIENLSGTLEISDNINLSWSDNLKEGMQYVVYVHNSDTVAHNVQIRTDSVEIGAGETKQLVFLAITPNLLQLQTCEGGGGGGQTPGNGTITLIQGGVEKGTFTVNQSTDTTIELDAGSENAMEYPDFNFVDKTGTVITLDLNSTITATNNFTVNAPAEIKDGQIYVLRVDVGGNTEFTMTLGENITNPYNVDISLGTNTLSQFVFLAVDGNLELQPQLMTRVDVENILREYNLIP